MNNQNSGPWRQSLAAARLNLWPGLALQTVALGLLASYYWIPDIRAFFDQVALLKQQMGWWYGLISTAVFGGVIPFLFLRLNPATRAMTPYSHGLFYILFWGYKGLEVDALYRLQAWLFGSGNDWRTLSLKVLGDQLIYNPIWSAPMSVFFFHWKELGFGLANLRKTPWLSYLKQAIPPALVSTWIVWVPTVTIIYSLPSSLQVPLFNVVLCFWVLLLTTLTRHRN